ncbi:RNA-directed DNA polymerase, eukaryota [Tanacetum coccineum]|uniref:RNA-directed DNA polymerase, eukaryota n=1 Tax=Tanacetum coccineum TaxID=301880 RepID=A0ABQ5D683_9ASTR
MVKDFRPICLIGSLYKIIAKNLANRLVVVLGDIVNEVQSAFVADRQILDGLFILNEVLQWCKLKKNYSFILKIDFEMAYDSVRSVLVNGSPTEEFQFFKGLKQGDPLSPFIFILVMESLHISFNRVVDAGMFNDIVLNSVMHLSHMFYADDAVFMWQWSTKNIDTIIYVLKCFHRASSLSINLSKSKLLGIVVSEDRVVQAANRIGCGVLKAPFAYLDTYFWEDLWHGDMVLKQRYPRLYALEVKKTVDVASKLSQENLTWWYWMLDGSGEFSVASARKVIDDNRFSEVSTQTRWIKAVPIKVNIHAWKVRMDCLPTRLNISRRGVPVDPGGASVVDALFGGILPTKDNT